MKTLLTLFVLFFSSSVFSSPIWEISNNWKCKTFLHTKMHRTGEIIGINESSNTIWLDFKNLTVMTGYSDSISELKKIKYIKSNYRSQHILEVKWKSSTRYLIIEENNGVYYYSSTTGQSNEDEILWSAHYECTPIY